MTLATDWAKPLQKEGYVLMTDVSISKDSNWQPDGGLDGSLLGGSSVWLSLYSRL